MFQDSIDMAMNVKILLYLFQEMAGLKINFDKSEALLVLEDSIKLEYYSKILNCRLGSWPMKYLDAPVSGSRIRIVIVLNFIEETCLKQLYGWQGVPCLRLLGKF
jgi:hypothetical protein